MKKAILIFAIVAVAYACGPKASVNELTLGMTTDQVIEKMGKPDKRMPFMLAEFMVWDNQGVRMVTDSLAEVIPDFKAYWKETEKSMKEAQKALDNFGQTMDSANQAIQKAFEGN